MDQNFALSLKCFTLYLKMFYQNSTVFLPLKNSLTKMLLQENIHTIV